MKNHLKDAQSNEINYVSFIVQQLSPFGAVKINKLKVVEKKFPQNKAGKGKAR